jgi:hypothetical protein
MARDPGVRLPFDFEIRLILQVAMVLFIYTVAIGIINGLDLVDFERKPLLAHLHVGTLGWITMAVFAVSLWLFGDEAAERNDLIRWTARLAPAVAFLYGLAFFTTTSITRPVAGSLMGVVIVVFFVWGFSRARQTQLSVVHLGMLAGLASSVIGAVFGVLSGLLVSNPDLGLTENISEAHPAAMVVGFLVPVGMAFTELVMRPESRNEVASRIGQVQIGAPFLGGLVLLVALLIEAEALAPLALLLEVVGILCFLWRLVPHAREVSLISVNPARHALFGGPFLVVNIVILVYLISNYIEDFEAAPRRLVLALDHSIFVGVLTNSILALILTISTVRRPAWVDHAVFVGVNVGVTGFIVGLLADVDIVLNIFTPLLGVAILLAIGVHVVGMRGVPREVQTAEAT